MINKNKVSVLFVCLGNICRSPTAHGVFRALVDEQGLAGHIAVDSAGTAAYHVGNAPDERSAAAALRRGYDLADLRARQAIVDDFAEFDYILAMDEQNLIDLESICPVDFSGHLGLFLELAPGQRRDVPDPYYGGSDGFDQVLDLVEQASHALLQKIRVELGQ
ncbi:MAG: low molecular weight protein-tyrosine-phosphatase [Amphritea sp.]